MTLGSLATFVGSKIGMSDADTLTKIKTWAQERYRAMWAAALWKDALSIQTIAVAANQSTVILPPNYSQFISAKYASTELIPVDQAFLFATNPGLWDEIGSPVYVSELAAVATRIMPTPTGTLRLNSSSPSDYTVVSISGEDRNGDPYSERVTLTGTVFTYALGTYSVIYSISRNAAPAALTVTDLANMATLLTLPVGEFQRSHRRLRLHATPAAGLTLAVLAKRHPGPFSADSDATGLPDPCDQALQAMVHGDALEWQQQYGKAQTKFAEGLKFLSDAKTAETYQAANAQRMIPRDSLGDGCSEEDFL